MSSQASVSPDTSWAWHGYAHISSWGWIGGQLAPGKVEHEKHLVTCKLLTWLEFQREVGVPV